MKLRPFSMDILSKLFQKRGINGVEELNAEERQVFETYQRTLSKRELTMEDLGVFLESQIGIIEARWRDHETTKEKKADLIPYHTVYKTLLQAIKAPELERQQLENYLNQQL